MSDRRHDLPTLAELRARRAAAMQAAVARFIPRVLMTGIPLVPALAAAMLMGSGRIDRQLAVAIAGGAALLGLFWTGYVVLDYVRRILPEELTRAGLICHACGQPLVQAAAARGGAAYKANADRDLLAAIEGKCQSCKTWVISDGLRGAA